MFVVCECICVHECMQVRGGGLLHFMTKDALHTIHIIMESPDNINICDHVGVYVTVVTEFSLHCTHRPDQDSSCGCHICSGGGVGPT